MLGQEVGSIIGLIVSKVPGLKVYDREVPKDFKRPSIYIPAPIDVDSPFTSSAYQVTHQLFLKIFDKDAVTGQEKADIIVNRIRSGRYLIPLLNLDATQTGRWLRVDSVQSRILDVEDGIIQISVDWTSRYSYSQETYPKIGEIFLSFIEE